MNFRKFLKPETIKLLEDRDEYYSKRKLEIKNLSNDNLADTAKYYLTQMEAPKHWKPGDPVYDAVFYYIIIPEILERLKK